MVPRITSKGRSFLGAGAYFLHDLGGAETAERVGFTHTVNMLTDDPQKALRVMTWTAGHAEELKALSGQKRTGRKAQDPVYNYCLAWAPDQDPSKDDMVAFGLRSMVALGVEDHEALFVAHDDTDHKHLHVILNRVHPITGLMSKMSHDRNLLSRLSQSYEEETGRVYCVERVKNNLRRDLGEAGVKAAEAVRLMETPAYKERRAARVVAQRQASTLATEQRDRQRHDSEPAASMGQRERARRAWLDAQRGSAWDAYESVHWQRLNDRHTTRRENLNERLKAAETRDEARLERKYAETEKYARRRIERLEEQIAVSGVRSTLDRLTGRQAKRLEDLAAARKGWDDLQGQKSRERDARATKHQGQREAEQARQRLDREEMTRRLDRQRRERDSAFEAREEARRGRMATKKPVSSEGQSQIEAAQQAQQTLTERARAIEVTLPSANRSQKRGFGL